MALGAGTEEVIEALGIVLEWAGSRAYGENVWSWRSTSATIRTQLSTILNKLPLSRPGWDLHARRTDAVLDKRPGARVQGFGRCYRPRREHLLESLQWGRAGSVGTRRSTRTSRPPGHNYVYLFYTFKKSGLPDRLNQPTPTIRSTGLALRHVRRHDQPFQRAGADRQHPLSDNDHNAGPAASARTATSTSR